MGYLFRPCPAEPAMPSPSPETAPGELAALRTEIDRLDEALHDLLMRRAEVVVRVAASADKADGMALRPGREAAIIRRLLARHLGELPPQTLVRLWRELLAGTTAMQRSLLVAATDELAATAREHFGALTPLRTRADPVRVLAELAEGATAAVLPMPRADEPAPWWPMLMTSDHLFIIARLPFWAPRGEGAPRPAALVVAPGMPDASGADRTLLGLEPDRDATAEDVAAALQAAGIAPRGLILRRDPAEPVTRALAETDGFVTDADPRLRRLGVRATVLGAYAIPLGAIPLDAIPLDAIPLGGSA